MTDERDRAGQSYGKAGGYNRSPGESGGEFADREAGAVPAAGAEPESQAYTGQTGTGYGRSPGGDAPDAGEDRSLWDRAKDGLGLTDTSDPQSYTRTDERVRDDVSERLRDDPFLDASRISVVVEDGEVTLSGEVSGRSDKRRAADLADDVSGVKQVRNQLRVDAAEHEPGEPEA